MFRFIASVLALGLLAIPGLGLAASIIELRGVDQNQPIANDIEVNGDWVRITIRDGGQHTEIQFDSTRDAAYIIDHQERTITELTEQGIQDMGNQLQSMMSQVQAQLEQSMAGMSEQQKAQLGGLLGNLGVGEKKSEQAAASPQARFSTDGTIREVNGIRCTEGIMTVNDLPQSRVCLADQADIPLPDADYRVLRKLVAFGGRIADMVSTMFPAVGMAMPSFDLDTIDGLPVEVRDDAMQVAVTAIRQEDHPAMSLPQDYTRRSNPMLGQ